MNNATPMYKVTKRFTAGLLEGLTITEVTSVKFAPGFYKACVGGSHYEVLACERLVDSEVV